MKGCHANRGPSKVFIPTEDVNKTLDVNDTGPQCLAEEASGHNNGNEEVIEVHDSLVIDSCIVTAEVGHDVPAP